MIGIYKITNTFNGKIYIGQSQDIEVRKNQHFEQLIQGKHHNKAMQRDYKLHPEAFVFEIQEECAMARLNVCEKYWIRYYNSGDPTKGYNGNRGGGVKRKRQKGLLDRLTD